MLPAATPPCELTPTITHHGVSWRCHFCVKSAVANLTAGPAAAIRAAPDNSKPTTQIAKVAPLTCPRYAMRSCHLVGAVWGYRTAWLVCCALAALVPGCAYLPNDSIPAW
jgi:hypothetical protein